MNQTEIKFRIFSLVKNQAFLYINPNLVHLESTRTFIIFPLCLLLVFTSAYTPNANPYDIQLNDPLVQILSFILTLIQLHVDNNTLCALCEQRVCVFVSI